MSNRDRIAEIERVVAELSASIRRTTVMMVIENLNIKRVDQVNITMPSVQKAPPKGT